MHGFELLHHVQADDEVAPFNDQFGHLRSVQRRSITSELVNVGIDAATLQWSARTVYYASYGSNLSSARLACYLRGGRPSGAGRTYSGARDRALPSDSVTLSIPHRLYFTGSSKVWGGATAFVDTTSSVELGALARAYLITWEQFEDVVAEENGRPTAPIDIAPTELTGGFSRCIGPGRYENLLCVGRHDGRPIVTFTAPWALADREPATPVPAYLAMVIGGLRESHDLDDTAITDYLTAAPGCTGRLAAAALAMPGLQR